jgi:hypothetical protein
MPCYLRGRIVISDEDKLIEEAAKTGIVLDKERAKEWIKLAFEQKINTKEIIRNYNISKIKMAAQKKGWKISSIEQKDDKIIIKIKE